MVLSVLPIVQVAGLNHEINKPQVLSAETNADAKNTANLLGPKTNEHNSEAEEAKKLIHKLNTELIPQWSKKYNLPAPVTSLIKMGVPFLDDNWGPRILAAMGNEVAEALKPSMKELGVPKFLSSIIYYGSWAVALGSCSARAGLRALGNGSYKPLVKSAGQDLVAAIGGPTLIVLAANWIQNQVYDRIKALPSAVKSIVRPFVSLLCSYLTIPRILDPIGIKFGNWAVSLLPKNESISSGLEKYFLKKDSAELAKDLRKQGIEAVAFDMDGTLVETEDINLKIVEDGLKKHKIALTETEKQEYVGTTIQSFCQMILNRRGIADAEKKAKEIAETKNKLFPEMLKTGQITAFNKVIDLVKALYKQGFKLALVTSSRKAIMQQVLEHFQLSDMFSVQLAREDADDKLKPNPYIYNKALTQLNLNTSPSKVLVFEDSAPGINSAHGSGANVVVIKNLETQNPTKIPSDSRIHKLDMTQFSGGN
jgi:HAD superfamily hydrolase (TIGR01509 family)